MQETLQATATAQTTAQATYARHCASRVSRKYVGKCDGKCDDNVMANAMTNTMANTMANAMAWLFETCVDRPISARTMFLRLELERVLPTVGMSQQHVYDSLFETNLQQRARLVAISATTQY